MKKVLENRAAIAVFIVSALIVYSGIVILPVLWSLYYSFYSGPPGLKWEFCGFDNSFRLFGGTDFKTLLVVNLKYISVVMLGQVSMGLLLAPLFNFWSKRFKNVIRTLVFFPVVLPTVTVGQLFQKIYEIQPNCGLLDSLLDGLGLTNLVQPWIGQASTALGSLCVMNIWVAMGFYVVIFYGALLDIPGDVTEATRIDGTSGLQLFRYVLMPLLRTMIITCLILSFLGMVKMFESVTALTNGGPGAATRSLSIYMYDVSFTYNKVGYGSVVALFILLLCVMDSSIIRGFDYKE